MVETEQCPRCSVPETIEHQLYSCPYTIKLWKLTSEITCIPIRSLNEVLGYEDTHDKTTITLHAEIITRLLSIERPIQDQKKLLKSAITKLMIVEKGITKYQVTQMTELLKNIT